MEVIVIGGGPCGLLSAINIKKVHPNYKVLLLEKEKDIGPRIKISGNGRCNFINKNLVVSKYSSSFVDHILKYQGEVLKILEEVGFAYFFDEEGRGYPLSENSSTVIQVLKDLLEKYQVEYLTSYQVTNIIKQENKYVINNQFTCDKLVVATGGISYLNDRLNYNRIISELQLSTTMLTPSLAPISVSSFPKELENKKIKCHVKLLDQNKIVFEESGEVLFKKDGLSGIVIFNLSAYLSRLHLTNYQNYQISLNLLPTISDDKLKELIRINPNLNHILIKELADYIFKFEDKFKAIRDLRFKVRGIYEFKNSQVTSGGVKLNQINSNLSLKSDPNIFLGGELLDIDGMCGGYNIGYALCAGYLIGISI